MKKYLKILIVTLLFLGSSGAVFAQENVGIVQGLWFSEKVFYANDAVRIYAAVQNNTGYDVEGVIEFFDNNVSLCEKTFAALNDRIIESWIDFIATEGDHNFTVKIKQLNKDEEGGEPLPVVGQVIATQGVMVVEVDTDGDDVPDSEDLDDDGDGVSDVKEVAEGSDPLNAESKPKESAISTTDGSEVNGGGEPEAFQDFLEKMKSLVGGITEKKSSDGDDSGDEVGDSKDSTSNTTINNFITQDLLTLEEKKRLLDQLPEQVQEITKNTPVLEPVALAVSKVQKRAQDFVEKKKTAYLEADIDLEKDSFDLSVKKVASQKIQKNIWEQIAKVFDIWWIFLAPLFVMIWIVLKLLFKVFGRIIRSRAE